MSQPIHQVCVYCASSALTPQKYLDATDVLAKALVAAKINVVFGGGSTGLMGRLADSVLALGGSITGIMPQFMKEIEWAHTQVDQMHLVADMHERKKKFLEGTDALIALPGGTGTLEELVEAITLKKLGFYPHPIVILNLEGFYDPLLLLFERMTEEKFMSTAHQNLYTVVTEADDILPAIYRTPLWEEPITQARVK